MALLILLCRYRRRHHLHLHNLCPLMNPEMGFLLWLKLLSLLLLLLLFGTASLRSRGSGKLPYLCDFNGYVVVVLLFVVCMDKRL